MGLQNVRGFTQRATGILTVLLSKIGFWLRISLQAHFSQLVDNQLVLKSQLVGWKSQLAGWKSQLRGRKSQLGILNPQFGSWKPQLEIRKAQLGILNPQFGDLLTQ